MAKDNKKMSINKRLNAEAYVFWQVKRFIDRLFLLCFIILAISYFLKTTLPNQYQVIDEMYRDPVQKQISEGSFYFDHEGKEHEVRPLYDYEVWGVVVTKNDIRKWYNYYHDKNSVNIKDICIVWGANLRNESYLKMRYDSGEFTCYFSTNDDNIYSIFDPYSLSNNHLLAEKEEIKEMINDMEVGDQIRLKGQLVDYKTEGWSSFRKTSISRNDTNQSSRGGGACEIVFVEEAEILKRANLFWHNFFEIFKMIFILLVIVKIILFIIEFKKRTSYKKGKYDMLFPNKGEKKKDLFRMTKK